MFSRVQSRCSRFAGQNIQVFSDDDDNNSRDKFAWQNSFHPIEAWGILRLYRSISRAKFKPKVTQQREAEITAILGAETIFTSAKYGN